MWYLIRRELLKMFPDREKYSLVGSIAKKEA